MSRFDREKAVRAFIISTLIFSVFLLILMVGVSFRAFTTYEISESVPLDTGWDIAINGVEHHDVRLDNFTFPPVRTGDVIELTGTLPQGNIPNPQLVFYIRYCTAEVYVAGNRIYETGIDRYNRGLLVGSGYNLVNLPDDYQGQPISMTFMVGETNSFSSLNVPVICDATRWTMEFASSNLVTIAISFFLIIFGLAVAVLALAAFLIRRNTITEARQILNLSAFSIACGCWILTSQGFTIIFTRDLIQKVYVEYICFYLLPVTLLGFYSFYARGEGGLIHRFQNILFCIMCIEVAVIAVMHTLNIIHMPSFLMIGQLMDVITLVLIIVGIIYEFRRDKVKKLFSTIGIIGIAIEAIFELFRYLYYEFITGKGSANYNSPVLYITLLIFLFSLLLDFINSLFMSAEERTRLEITRTLAYKDYMTGIGNRTLLEKELDAADETGNPYSIIVFDINGLKRVNDTFGHDEGDRYITSFADILSGVCKGRAFVGRSGGDEFVVITHNKETAEDIVAKVNIEIEQKNRAEENWQLSSAYGICHFEDLQGSSRDRMKLADERMYSNKRLYYSKI